MATTSGSFFFTAATSPGVSSCSGGSLSSGLLVAVGVAWTVAVTAVTRSLR